MKKEANKINQTIGAVFTDMHQEMRSKLKLGDKMVVVNSEAKESPKKSWRDNPKAVEMAQRFALDKVEELARNYYEQAERLRLEMERHCSRMEAAKKDRDYSTMLQVLGWMENEVSNFRPRSDMLPSVSAKFGLAFDLEPY